MSNFKGFKKMLLVGLSSFVLVNTAVPVTVAEASVEDYGVELLADKPEVAELEINNIPNRIIATLNETPQTSMSFNWYTSELFEDSVVMISTNVDMSDAQEFSATATEVDSEYMQRDAEGNLIFADIQLDENGQAILDDEGNPEEILGYYTDEGMEENEAWTGGAIFAWPNVSWVELQNTTEYSYKATATDLEPGTTYYYQVGSLNGEMSNIGTFRTASADEATEFIFYSDTQNIYYNENVNNEADYAADTLARALDLHPEANFAIHGGDFIDQANIEDEWVDLMTQSAELYAEIPHVVVPGNHDQYTVRSHTPSDPTIFNEHFNVPVTNDAISGGSYYSFDYNNAHFIVLNTNDHHNEEVKMIGDKQLAWLEEDITQAKDNGSEWIIVNMHKSLITPSFGSLTGTDVQASRHELMSLFDELDVDIVLQAHDHVLSVSRPLEYDSENFVAMAPTDDSVDFDNQGRLQWEDPEGTIFFTPNTAGTKSYDAIYQRGLEHVQMVQPSLDWMTEENIEFMNSLFVVASQPFTSSAFETSTGNLRDSTVQNFMVFNIEDNEAMIKIYQVSGDLEETETRPVHLVEEISIVKE